MSLLIMLPQAWQMCAECCVLLRISCSAQACLQVGKELYSTQYTLQVCCSEACQQLKTHFDVQVAAFDLLATLPEHTLPSFSMPAIDEV